MPIQINVVISCHDGRSCNKAQEIIIVIIRSHTRSGVYRHFQLVGGFINTYMTYLCFYTTFFVTINNNNKNSPYILLV